MLSPKLLPEGAMASGFHPVAVYDFSTLNLTHGPTMVFCVSEAEGRNNRRKSDINKAVCLRLKKARKIGNREWAWRNKSIDFCEKKNRGTRPLALNTVFQPNAKLSSKNAFYVFIKDLIS